MPCEHWQQVKNPGRSEEEHQRCIAIRMKRLKEDI
jgi:hypothetical protein